jgi:SRSO17 transposase
MNFKKLQQVQEQLKEYVYEFKEVFNRKERQHWCYIYLSGLILDGERKSIEPIANRIPGADIQSLQQFVNQSSWEHEPLQDHLFKFMLKEFKPQQGVLILDDTTLPKKGNHSVGVARQYCGALGKVSNCQSLVTWHFANESLHFPCNGELYLPEEWTKDKKKMASSGVPEERFQFKRKWEIALSLLAKITRDVPHDVTLFDAGYGEIRPFLGALDQIGENFIGQIPESHSFWPLDIELKKPSRHGRPKTYNQIADHSNKSITAKRWKDELLKTEKWVKIVLPLKIRKTVEAAEITVLEVNKDWYYRPGPKRRLVIMKTAANEWKYFVTNLPQEYSLEQIILLANMRWKIEQGYQQLKEELGLDHFEGRSWKGLHHHLSLCFMAYNFLQLLKKNSEILSI